MAKVGGSQFNSQRRYKRTSIGRSANSRPKNKKLRYSRKDYRGQGSR